MQKYRKYLALLFLTAAAATVTGCGISEKEASITSGAQTAHMQTDEEPANIVLINNIYYYDTGSRSHKRHHPFCDSFSEYPATEK